MNFECRCERFAAGHGVHATDAFRAVMLEAIDVHAEVDADGWITVRADDVVGRVWNHEPTELADRLSDAGGQATIRGDDCLTVPYGSGQRAFFSIAPEPTECHRAEVRTDDLVGDPAARSAT